MREGSAKTAHVGFPFPIVRIPEYVCVLFLEQCPTGARVRLDAFLSVPCVHPLRIDIPVVTTGNECAAGLGEPVSGAAVTGHGDRASVLDRYAERLRPATAVALQFIGERCDQDGSRRAPFTAGSALGRVNFGVCVYGGALGEQTIVRVFHVVCRVTRFPVEPQVANHAVDRGMGAGRQRGVTHDRFRVGVGVVSVAVDDPGFPEVTEATVTQAVVVARRQVTAKLIHGDLQNEFRLVLSCGCARSEHCCQQAERDRDFYDHSDEPATRRHRHAAGPKSYFEPPEFCSCSMTWSMPKLAAFCRGGYSLKVARNRPT